MKLAYLFRTTEKPELTQVGGKAMSLILMSQYGLPVPPGFVLSVAFFEPWLEAIQQTPEWAAVLNSAPEMLKQHCNALKAKCTALELDTIHKATLTQALETLKTGSENMLLAVRSSAPEEDLEGFSFAGGYETTLGVTEETLEDALRRSFASCFDERVFVYKKEHGLKVDQPRIAIIIQQQIASETAGVAFSLNPLNNCYDEAVINANFGLGESVVAGQVSPDSFTIDKVTHTITERRKGNKETSIWLKADGGTYKEPSPARTGLCLSDEEVLELTGMLVNVESYYQKPVDIEWAYAGGKLYLLQARPITAYFPLPDSLLTKPEEQKFLYGDLTLIKWGMPRPLSVIGTDYLKLANTAALKMTMGDVGPEVTDKLRVTTEGRTYINVSYSIKMQGKDKAAGFFQEIDNVSTAIIENADEAEYVPQELPPAMKGLIFKMIGQNLGMVWHGLRAHSNPEAYQQRYLDEIKEMDRELEMLANGGLSMRDFAEGTMDCMIKHLDPFFATIIAAQLARWRMKKIFKDAGPEVQEQLGHLERALPGNITIEMGLAMYHLAQYPEIRECKSGEEFATKLEARELSQDFQAAWSAFMDRFGFRSPMEMDPAAVRYYEQPAQFFEQLRTLSENTNEEQTPQVIFERTKAQRERAYHKLLQAAEKKGKRYARRFTKSYHTWITLAGYRETPKYSMSLIAAMFRKRALSAASVLVDAGRLDNTAQVFDLSIDELDRALANPELDLRALIAQNTRYQEKFRHVREFPRIVDSRGKILRAPRKEAREGELAGEPISPGVVRGPIKVLHEPDEKPILPGDILVARATDPGWTPLFLNAGGIILEVGGMLQHGALVAREYGKPCISGLEHATGILTDGQMVEMDGASGVIRIV